MCPNTSDDAADIWGELRVKKTQKAEGKVVVISPGGHWFELWNSLGIQLTLMVWPFLGSAHSRNLVHWGPYFLGDSLVWLPLLTIFV